MTSLLLVLLALIVFIGDTLAWPRFLQTAQRRALAGVTTVVAAGTGLHIVNVQIQRHHSHLPWYDEDDFWMSVLRLPTPLQPLPPLLESCFTSFDYFHIWNSTSAECEFMESGPELDLRPKTIAHEANSSTAYVFFKTYSPDFDAGHTLNTSSRHLVGDAWPIYLSVGELPFLNLRLDTYWLFFSFAYLGALAVIVIIAARRQNLRSLQLGQEVVSRKAYTQELDRFIKAMNVTLNKLEALITEESEDLQMILAVQKITFNDVDTLEGTLTAQIAAIDDFSMGRKSENERQLLAKEVEISALKATNQTLATDIVFAKAAMAVRDEELVRLRIQCDTASLSRRERRKARLNAGCVVVGSSAESKIGSRTPVDDLPSPPATTNDPLPEPATSTSSPKAVEISSSKEPSPNTDPLPEAAANTTPPKAAEEASSPKESGAQSGSNELLSNAPKGPKVEATPFNYSNKTVYFNAAARQRDRTNAPLANPQPQTQPQPQPPSQIPRRFIVPRLTKTEEKKAMAESIERIKKRAAAATAATQEEGEK